MKSEKLQLKIKSFLFAFWPVLFILAVWFIFSSPYFLKGLVPYPSTYQVNHFHPWSDYEKYWGPVKNDAMPDIIDQIYPWRHYTIESLKQGRIPYWSPYSFAGNPHLANFQSAVFSPFNLLFFIFPFIDAWSLLILLQPLLAGFFMYLFLRELGVSKSGGVLSGSAFMFCGFIVVWMAYGILAMAVAFLPLALLGVEKSIKKTQILPLSLLSIGICFSFFSGHFQTSFYVLLFIFAYLVFRSLQVKNKKRILFAWMFFAIGILISLVQLLPSIVFYNNAVRSEIYQLSGGIPFHYLITIIAPDFFGNPVTRNNWYGFYAEWASFIGIIPLTLAGFAIWNKRQPITLFFFLIGLAALFMAIDTPFHHVLQMLKIPVLSTSIPSRIIILLSFSIATLAGFGLDVVKEYFEKTHKHKIFPVLRILAVSLAIIWFVLIMTKPFNEQTAIALKNFILPSALFVMTVFLLSVHRFIKSKKIIFFLLFALLTLTAFDSYRFAQKWMPFDPKNLVYSDIPVVKKMQELAGNNRVYGNIRAQVGTYYGIQLIEGYDPLYNKRYGEFISSANQGKFKEAERSVVNLNRRGLYADRVLDLLGVHLIFHPIADTNQSWAYPVWEDHEKYSVVYQDEKFQLFRNNTALPRAKLYYYYQVIPDDKDAIKTFYSEDFDFRNTLILAEDPHLAAASVQDASGEAELMIYLPENIVIKTNTQVPALLFLPDNYYPGWKVRVNGREEKIYRADYAFRAVIVPEGESVVEFYYNPFM